MQQNIPDELGREMERLAEGLNLGMDEVVRDALAAWVERARRRQGKRLPDSPILEDENLGPELPGREAREVEVIRGPDRVPDGIGLD